MSTTQISELKHTTAKEEREKLKRLKGRLAHAEEKVRERDVAEVEELYASIRRPTHTNSAPYAIMTAPDGTREVIISHAYPPNVRGFAKSCADRTIRKLEQVDRLRAKLEARKAGKQ